MSRTLDVSDVSDASRDISTKLAEIKLSDERDSEQEHEPLESYELVPTPTSLSQSTTTSSISNTSNTSNTSNAGSNIKYESIEIKDPQPENKEKIKEKMKLTNKLKKKRQRKIRAEKKALIAIETNGSEKENEKETGTGTETENKNKDKIIINEKLPVLLDYETKRSLLDKDPTLYKRALSEFQKHCVIQQISACKTIEHKTNTFQMITGLFVSHLRHFQKYLSQQCRDRKSGLWYFSLDLIKQDDSWPYTDVTEAPTFITEIQWNGWILTEKNKTKLRFMRHQVLPIIKRTNLTRQCVLVCSMPTRHMDFRKCTHMMGVVVYDHELANLL